MKPIANQPTDRLDGWREIAEYLRRDVRTIQRWEKQEGLPVHRHSGRRSRVWALRSEVDAWWHHRELTAAQSPPSEVSSDYASHGYLRALAKPTLLLVDGADTAAFVSRWTNRHTTCCQLAPGDGASGTQQPGRIARHHWRLVACRPVSALISAQGQTSCIIMTGFALNS